jgi:GNAT superfamily N-acetyltransferase
MNINIRLFEKNDAEAVSRVIAETAEICNGRDYPPQYIEDLKNAFQPSDVIRRASWTHFYVVEADGVTVGCGAIGPYWDSLTESCLFTIFVLPEYQGTGLGRRLIETLEADEYGLRAKRIEVPASITAHGFYHRLGYEYKGGVQQLDEKELVYRMEKFTGR